MTDPEKNRFSQEITVEGVLTKFIHFFPTSILREAIEDGGDRRQSLTPRDWFMMLFHKLAQRKDLEVVENLNKWETTGVQMGVFDPERNQLDELFSNLFHINGLNNLADAIQTISQEAVETRQSYHIPSLEARAQELRGDAAALMARFNAQLARIIHTI